MNTPVIDLHIDTIYALFNRYSSGDLRSNTGHVDLQRMKTLQGITSCFALFVDGQETPGKWDAVSELHRSFLEQMRGHGETIDHVATGEKTEGCHALLSVEEGGVLEGDLARLEILHSWGVRLMTIGWNWENELGFPHYQKGALKPFGHQVVKRMEELKILVDVSHLNDEGINDIVTIAKRPVVASHSNCRRVCNHSRNLSDELIGKIAETGGVVGLTFCPPFVIRQSTHTSVEALAAHCRHLYKVGGSEILALGTDYDGFTGTCEIRGYQDLHILHSALERVGFSSSVLDGFWYRNARRVLDA